MEVSHKNNKSPKVKSKVNDVKEAKNMPWHGGKFVCLFWGWYNEKRESEMNKKWKWKKEEKKEKRGREGKKRGKGKKKKERIGENEYERKYFNSICFHIFYARRFQMRI